MTTLQHRFLRNAVLRFKQKTLEHKHERPYDKGWNDAHNEFAARLDRLEAGLIQALQELEPKEIHR